VTAGALLRLYGYLDRLQERALYCDTDSVLYVQITDEEPLITCADNLSDRVSELGPSEYIQEFVSGGPKIYAYKIIDKTTGKDKTVCKVRGFTLNYSAKYLVNFDVIRNTILYPEDNDTVTVRTEKKIKRKRNM
jgi:nucleoside-triphosphatase THEP1